MTETKQLPANVRQFIVETVERNPIGVVARVAKRFKVTRQTAHRQVHALVAEGALAAQGYGKGMRYTLPTLAESSVTLPITVDSAEHAVWREQVLPHLAGLPANVLAICEHGLTEMVNNAIDHSGSPSMTIRVSRDAASVELTVYDRGVGIFNKIREACHLDDARHAVLELTKGKLTTDPTRHSGEGIFFTSRMFDLFSILSGMLYFSTVSGQDWLVEGRDETPGTFVWMTISTFSQRTTAEVFHRYASAGDDYGFSRTHIPVELARYEGETLISRSQAKRLLARTDRFREVMLDFKGVTTIGQAFADEVFRVFATAHPDVHLFTTNETPNVAGMIQRARAGTLAAE